MKLKEMYDQLESNWEEVVGRFAGNEKLLLKFTKKFQTDLSYSNLCDAVEKEDHDQILLHAHTLKGVALNLGFDCLGKEAAKVVKDVREEKYGDIPADFLRTKEEHEKVIQLLSQLDE